jgi:DNA-directed RNA polymerase subunit RPC12/RpoP
MKPLTATELLTVWERGLNRPLLQKTLNLLTLACPEMDADTVAKLSIGERDARLLLLREWMFGSRLMNMAVCPRCSERIEWETPIEKIRLQPVQQHDSAREFSMEVDHYNIRFRLPASLDVSTVIANSEGLPDPAKLLVYCILDSRCKGEACKVDDLPDKVVQAISRRMDEEDPQADIRMLLNCPHCSHRWKARFDIASYLWAEIDRWAKRMLLDVQKLARTFHWSERDILTMSPVRRQLYLGMVNG